MLLEYLYRFKENGTIKTKVTVENYLIIKYNIIYIKSFYIINI